MPRIVKSILPASKPAKSSLRSVRKTLGFGFVPEETQIHFLVDIPRSTKQEIGIYERALWAEGEQTIDHRHDELKVILSQPKWELVKDVYTQEFNNRLASKRYQQGRWQIGHNPVHRLLGKELLVLAWAIADCEPSVIGTAAKNWLGLRPEERWWLYTMTNATSGRAENNYGWRKALRYALTENPILDSNKKSTLFFNLTEDDL